MTPAPPLVPGFTSTPRRAFALPVVLMLVMLATLMLSVMLQRSGAQGYTVKRQTNAYLEHHASRGFQEVLNFWIRSLGTIPVNEVLEQDGHVFDLELPDRSVVKVYLRDAQGTLCTSLTGIDPIRQPLVIEPLQWLQQMYPNRMDLVRSVGPIAVSAQSAPEEVLNSIEAAILDTEPKGALAKAIIDARADGTVTRVELLAAGRAAGMEAGQPANELAQLLTVEPIIYRAIVELYLPANRNRVAARYSGLMQLTPAVPAGPNNTNQTTLISSSLFLSWGPMPIE